MIGENDILRLYSEVLHEDIVINKIREYDIRKGIQNMAYVYAPETSSNWETDVLDRKFANYNIPAFRCAYIHKYAALHTYIVLDVIIKLIEQENQLFIKILNSGQFNLCCLGGGPGSDAVGILAAMHSTFTSFKSSVTIIDSMEQWAHTFNLIAGHLKYGGQYFFKENQWNYIGADLLGKMTTEVNKAIQSASFISMVKFISAATCKNTETMVEKIFRVMKPGALVFYIDNAAGGFTQVIERAGKKYNFKIICGPFRHMEYSNENLKVERFGYTSCYKTIVTVIVMQKPYNFRNNIPELSQPSHSDQNVAGKRIKRPLREVQNINDGLSSTKRVANQSKVNKALLPTNSVGATSAYNNFNQSTPNSYSKKVNNLNAKYQRYQPVPDSSSSISPNPVIVSITSSTNSPESTDSVFRDDPDDTCCSCCVIS